MKQVRGFVYLLVAAMFLCAGVVIAADKAPDTVEMAPKIWPSLSKGKVPFTHKKHVEDLKVACTQCHHKYVDGKNVWKEGDAVQRCETCHTEATTQGEKKLPPDQQKLNLKLAFHKNCVECHKTAKKDKPDSKAPVVCSGCHPGSTGAE